MSKCRHLRKHISRYIDNDLDDSRRRWLEKHMASCEECARVYGNYVAIKTIVQKSFASDIPEMAGSRPAKFRTKAVKLLPFSVWNAGTRLAAMVILGVSIYAGILIFSSGKQEVPAPLVIESESSLMMNTPLGALIYYEELSGRTVHAQYLQNIKEIKPTSFDETNPAVQQIIGYKSPLFCDNLSYVFE
jgi:hypothetical protein